MRRATIPGLLPWGIAVLFACDRGASPFDTVVDTTVEPTVWNADAAKIAAALPQRVGSFMPSEGADPFYTSFSTGPVFGASCAYADGARQLTVRVESGNVKLRATAGLDERSRSGADSRFVVHDVFVHGRPGVERWDGSGQTGEVVFVVARRYVVRLRVVPAANEGEVLSLAEAIDVSSLEKLELDGVTR